MANVAQERPCSIWASDLLVLGVFHDYSIVDTLSRRLASFLPHRLHRQQLLFAHILHPRLHRTVLLLLNLSNKIIHMIKTMVLNTSSSLPWDATTERIPSRSNSEISAIVSLPATRALESLNRQSKKRPRKSMESPHIDFTDLFDAVSGNDPFPKIEWPIDGEDVSLESTAHQHLPKSNNTHFITSTAMRSQNRLRKVSDTKMWTTNSLPQSKRSMTGLSSPSRKKAKTELNFQLCQEEEFNNALKQALSSYDQAQALEACKMAVTLNSFPELLTLVSE